MTQEWSFTIICRLGRGERDDIAHSLVETLFVKMGCVVFQGMPQRLLTK